MADDSPAQESPYAHAAGIYHGAGWRGVLPLPAHSKKPVPVGWTGQDGGWPSYADIQSWIDDGFAVGPAVLAAGNIALRLPHHVIGIDVDNYADKLGLISYGEMLGQFGPLPATWRSSSRSDGHSGIYLFTVPDGLAWPGAPKPGIEIIQYAHRYVVAWPSVHPEGPTYRWYEPNGAVSLSGVPNVDSLPALPEGWVNGLTGGALRADVLKAEMPDAEVAQWLHQFGASPACNRMSDALARYVNELQFSGLSRHDVAMRATARIARMISEGHKGGAFAIERLRLGFDRALEKTPHRGGDVGEWARLVEGAVNLAAVDGVAERDPCWDPFATLLKERGVPSSSIPNPSPSSALPATNVSTLGVGTSPTVPSPDASATTTSGGAAPTAGASPAGDPSTASPSAASMLLSIETERERARRAAKRLLDAEELSTGPDAGTLLVNGATFILDAPDRVPAVWGFGQEVAWAEGESLMLVGPAGVGKTTLAGQIVKARLGMSTEPVLGMTVTPTTSKVLYLAMDRPAQAARALRRIFSESDRAILAERLVIWKGPPPADVARQPDTFVNLARAAGADTIVVDSLKDAAIGLTADDVAAGYNRARQAALAINIQVLELHHLVKRGPAGTKPNTLADVYGSTWITAGAGSVILLWGTAGDLVVEFAHLKQPSEQIGIRKILHDHDTGQTSIFHSDDLVALVRVSGSITAKAAAIAVNETEKPTPNQVQQARRSLDALVKKGLLERREGTKAGDGNVPVAAVWTITTASRSDLSVAGLTAPTQASRNPANTPNAGPNGGHAQVPMSPLTNPTVSLQHGGVSDPEPEEEEVVSQSSLSREEFERIGKDMRRRNGLLGDDEIEFNPETGEVIE